MSIGRYGTRSGAIPFAIALTFSTHLAFAEDSAEHSPSSSIGVTICDQLAGSKNMVGADVGVDPINIDTIDYPEAVSACDDEIKAYPGEPRFLFNLARAEDGAKIYLDAWRDYNSAASHGSAYAMSNIGVLYQRGHGVSKDYAVAMSWYMRAAALGQTTAMRNIGILYEDGLGVSVDYAKAMEWFQKSANMDDPQAMSDIANMYEKGFGVSQDCSEAAKWFTRSASLKFPFGMRQIARLYQSNTCLSRDVQKAIQYYREAGELGDTLAMSEVVSLQGNDGVTDAERSQAVDWLVGVFRSINRRLEWKAVSHWYEWGGSFRVAFQQRLKSDGLYDGAIDGSWNPDLQRATAGLAVK